MKEEPLAITNILFDENAERIEPPQFHPDVKQYLIYPKAAATNITFSIVTNKAPADAEDKSDFYYKPFPNYHLYYKQEFEYPIYRWIPSSASDPTERKYYLETDTRYDKTYNVFCESESREAATIQYNLIVKPRALAPGECGHFNTYSEEGDVFGGASGSCSIETLIICRDCGTVVKKEYEYRD